MSEWSADEGVDSIDRLRHHALESEPFAREPCLLSRLESNSKLRGVELDIARPETDELLDFVPQNIRHVVEELHD